MKAEIDENGKLSVTPETSLESFALARWWDDYTAQDSDVGGEKHFAILEICLIVLANEELRAIRERAIAKGMPLLSLDEINNEQ